MTATERAQAIAVNEVIEFMRRRHLALADLTEYGGEDIPNPKLPGKIYDPARIKKARAVERCWELIARLGLNFAALEIRAQENFPHQHTAPTAPIRRGRKSNLKPEPFQQHNKSEADAEDH